MDTTLQQKNLPEELASRVNPQLIVQSKGTKMDSDAAFIGRGYPAKQSKPTGQQREISFVIPGILPGWGRATPIRTGAFARMITPLKTRSAQAVVRHFADEAMRPHAGDLLHGPLDLTMHVVRTCPPSWSKSKKSGAKWITGKPDADNSLKLCLDAMNGIVYTDDAQISCVSFHRTYGSENSVHITVAELT